MILIFSVVLALEQLSTPPLLNVIPFFNSWPISNHVGDHELLKYLIIS